MVWRQRLDQEGCHLYIYAKYPYINTHIDTNIYNEIQPSGNLVLSFPTKIEKMMENNI